MNNVTVEELKQVIALSELPEEHLQWILDHSEHREFDDGALIMKTGETAELMFIILEGRINFYLDVSGRLVYYFYFANDVLTGGVGGLLPYSRMKVYLGCSYAVGRLRVLRLHKKNFPEMEQLNPAFIQRLIGYMTERAKAFATTQLQHEKVNALGNLSAGIAHELNNPAAAISRIAAELTERLMLNYDLTEKLLFHNISPEHIQLMRQLIVVKNKERATEKKLSAMQQMEKEDELAEWLQNNGFPGNRLSTEIFAEARISVEDFESIRNSVGKEPFITMLKWLENILSSENIIKDLEDSSHRISKLVGAIKSHVHMDRTNDMVPTNIHEDIENTLTLLGFKLREKNIKVIRNFSENLPEVSAYVGELNQVWTNLIDNAIYALDKNGEITIETGIKNNDFIVRIIDNGKGIPAEIKTRIFEPFFTTKKVGEGTGIGLDLVKRIIKRHNGDIQVFSEPGKTEFMICIPVVHAKQKDQ